MDDATTRARRVRIELGPRAGEERRWPCVVSTEAPVERYDRYGEPYDEILCHSPECVDLSRAPLPVLEGHDSSRTNIGVVENLRLVDGKLRGDLVLGSSARATELAADIDAGIVGSLSVGYEIVDTKRGDAEGRARLTATKWRPFEVSIVSVPADIGAGINRSHSMDSRTGPEANRAASAPQTREKREGDMEREDEARETEERAERAECIECSEMDPDDPDYEECCGDSGDEAREFNEEREGEQRSRVRTSQPRGDGSRKERRRAEWIVRLATANKLPPELAAEHVRKGTSMERFGRIVAREIEKREREEIQPPRGNGVQAGADSRDKFRDGTEAWLLTRSRLADRVAEAARKRGEPSPKYDPGEFRGLTLMDLARECLERARPGSTRGLSRMEIAARALGMRSGGGGMATTSDYTTALENVMHKAMQAEYDLYEADWPKFCKTGSVADFRAHNRYRMGTFGPLDSLTEKGEFQNQYLADAEKETISASTKGNIVALTREVLINDDLGAFLDVAAKLGREAQYTIERDVFDLLALGAGLGPAMNDGDTLFHANHDNIGTDSTLTVAGLDADIVLLALQTGPGGTRVLNIKPHILLLPRALQGQAISIIGAEFDSDAVAANATNKFMVPNRVRGMFPVIIGSPFLTGTRRYIFADPGRHPVIEVVFLDGQQAPYMEMREGWRVDGVEWKVRLDFGVGAVDFRGAVTNDGTP